MALSIDRKLNMVIPIETHAGVTLYVHSTPIAKDTFEAYYKVMTVAFVEIYKAGLSFGPRIAKLTIQDEAKKLGLWEGPQGVKSGLINEIMRLSNVATPHNGKWQLIPLEDAVNQKIIDEDDVSEVENAICFFILASAIHRKKDLTAVLESTLPLWGARIESLNCTDFIAGLSKSIAVENTGEKPTAIPSSIPS